MLTAEDTIVAISTPIGEGGIGIVRLSGPCSISIATKIFKPHITKTIEGFRSRTLYLGHIVDPENDENIDEVLLTVFRMPHTYTKEDMVEINCHGGLIAQKIILGLAVKYGARVADPGEFTKRAFLNGRIDLSQAEAVIDVIRAKTDRALSLAQKQLAGGLSGKIKDLRTRLLTIIAHIEANIDFPEEDIPEASPAKIESEIIACRQGVKELLESAGAGRILREGISTLILGNTNVGKSSLLNTLVMDERAIVTDVPGTTRDIIEEYIDIKGIPIKIIDTAGIRETSDKVERIGIDRAMKYLEEAELILLMLDVSKALTEDDKRIIEMVKNKLVIVVFNKVDLPYVVEEDEVKALLPDKRRVKISALQRDGIEELKSSIYAAITERIGLLDESSIIAGERQRTILKWAFDALERSAIAMKSSMPVEMVEIDIREAWEKLGEITGETVGEDIISTIFENFCIGK